MSACVACGHDPSAIVLRTWAFFITREVPSLNAYRTNHGASRWAYKLDRDAWQQWFILLGRQHRIPTGDVALFRRVTLTRCYSGRQREYDRDNLIGGSKGVVDAMVRAGLLRGDDATRAEILYKQRKVATEPGLEIVIEELGK